MSGTTYTWNDTDGDWSTSADWAPNGPPGGGDTADILGDSSQLFTLTVTAAQSALDTELNAAGGTLTISSQFTIGGIGATDGVFNITDGTLDLNSGGSLSGYGTGSNTVYDQGGTIDFAGGTLDNLIFAGTVDLSALNASVTETAVSFRALDGISPGTIMLTGDGASLTVGDTETLSDVTINLGASVLTSAAAASLNVLSGSTLTFDTTTTLASAGGLFGWSQIAGGGSVVNNGSMSLAGTVTISDSFDNESAISIADSATIEFSGPSTVNNGLIQLGALDQVIIDNGLSGTGTINLASQGTVTIQGDVAGGVFVFGGSDDAETLSLSSMSFAGTIDNVQSGNTIDLTSVSDAAVNVSATIENGTLDVFTAGALTETLAVNGFADGYVFQASPDGAGTGTALVACYAQGTRIATARGEIAIEALRRGHMLMLAGGGNAPLVWLGHREVDLRAEPDQRPIRIAASAFGPGRPARDLSVSPEHGLFMDGVLIPAGALVNDASITVDETSNMVVYFHVELAEHGLVLAEGLAAESWRDTGNAAMFENAAERPPRAFTPAACAPMITNGPILERVRAQLGGAPFARLPIPRPGLYRATAPAGTASVRLLSAAVSTDADRRRLGVAVGRLSIDGEAVALSDRRLRRGFHPLESNADGAWRWTDGDAVLALDPATAHRIELRVVATAC